MNPPETAQSLPEPASGSVLDNISGADDLIAGFTEAEQKRAASSTPPVEAKTVETPEAVKETARVETPVVQDASEPQKQPAEPSEQITPEEAKRREEQSFKDKYYETQKQLDALKIQSTEVLINTKLQQDYQKFEAGLAPDRELYAELYGEFTQAQAEGENEAAAVIYRRAVTVLNRIKSEEAKFSQYAQNFEAERAKLHANERDRSIEEALGESGSGLTLAELRALEKELDTSKPKLVVKAVAKTAYDKGFKTAEAKYKAEIAELKTAKAEAQKKWTTESPASQTDRTTVGARGNGSWDSSSAYDDLRDGFSSPQR